MPWSQVRTARAVTPLTTGIRTQGRAGQGSARSWTQLLGYFSAAPNLQRIDTTIALAAPVHFITVPGLQS